MDRRTLLADGIGLLACGTVPAAGEPPAGPEVAAALQPYPDQHKRAGFVAVIADKTGKVHFCNLMGHADVEAKKSIGDGSFRVYFSGTTLGRAAPFSPAPIRHSTVTTYSPSGSPSSVATAVPSVSLVRETVASRRQPACCRTRPGSWSARPPGRPPTSRTRTGTAPRRSRPHKARRASVVPHDHFAAGPRDHRRERLNRDRLP